MDPQEVFDKHITDPVINADAVFLVILQFLFYLSLLYCYFYVAQWDLEDATMINKHWEPNRAANKHNIISHNNQVSYSKNHYSDEKLKICLPWVPNKVYYVLGVM